MRRPSFFTHTSSSNTRYNPIYEETEAKKAAATPKCQRPYPFFASIPRYDAAKPQPQQFHSPPRRTSGVSFATNYNTYTPINSTDDTYDTASTSRKRGTGNRRKCFFCSSFSFFGSKKNGEDIDIDVDDEIDNDDGYDYQSNPPHDSSANRNNPFLDPFDPFNPSNKQKKQKKQKPHPTIKNTMNREKLPRQEFTTSKRQQKREQAK